MPPKAFKPPRPSASAVSKPIKSKTTRKPTTKPKIKDKPKGSRNSTFKVPHVSSLPSHESQSDSDDPFASQVEVEDEDDPIEIDEEKEDRDEERVEGIPSDLLTRLLHENFKVEGTRLSKGASSAVGKYMETFVREALARAAFARLDAEEKGGGGDGFLEVVDLEVLAPQLLLDF